jgi:hypothetical protein
MIEITKWNVPPQAVDEIVERAKWIRGDEDCCRVEEVDKKLPRPTR